jgi:hypothetical protein
METICKQCGLVNNFIVKQNGPHITAYCNGCGAYIKNLPQQQEPKFYFGKYKGKLIKEVEDKNYLEWALINVDNLSEQQRKAIREKINFINEFCK